MKFQSKSFKSLQKFEQKLCNQALRKAFLFETLAKKLISNLQTQMFYDDERSPILNFPPNIMNKPFPVLTSNLSYPTPTHYTYDLKKSINVNLRSRGVLKSAIMLGFSSSAAFFLFISLTQFLKSLMKFSSNSFRLNFAIRW